MHDALGARALALLLAGFLTRAATNAGFAVTLSIVTDKRIRNFQQVLIHVLPAFCEYGTHSIDRLSSSSLASKSREMSVFVAIVTRVQHALTEGVSLGTLFGIKESDIVARFAEG